MSPPSVETASTTAAADRSIFPASESRVVRLRDRFHQIRKFTNALCADLEPEDCVVQSMPDVSPTKWHLAHTTWFFETFILKKFVPGYRAEIPEYAYLFNSYYNAAGDMHRRDLRGLISRPTLSQARRYRASIDSHIDDLLSSPDESLLDEIEPILVLGFHHEQQHQELLITDIKHVLAQNPLYPVFRPGRDGALRRPDAAARRPYQFIDFEQTTAEIGHDGRGFAYDNEGPRHEALVLAFALASRPVTNGEYIAFIEDNGYSRPEFWLSLGWMTVNEQRWDAPLYWTKRDGAWWNFTLSGLRRVDQSEPVTHVSYFEADAYANWAGARLPTEFEWERAALNCPIEGNFVETELFHPVLKCPLYQRTNREKSSSANVRRRLGMDAQRLLAVSRLPRCSRRAWRVQRQIYVQPICPARRFLRDIPHSHPPHLSQFLSTGKTLAVHRNQTRTRSSMNW